MKLAPLLASTSDDELDRLAAEHVRTDKRLPRPQLCNFLEGALRSYRFINDFVTNRQPPTFAALTLLLDAPGYDLPRGGFRERVLTETKRLADLIDSGGLLARDHQLRLYRRALYEARRNDLDLNSSEAALLTVLRRESGVQQVEHFLIEHHQDLREFWDKEDSFEHEENALRSAGVLFVRDDKVLIPEEVASAIWQTLGIDMPTDSARRLFGYLSGGELAGALGESGARTSGSKEVRLERMLVERIQPRVALRYSDLATLRGICRSTDASVSGNKDDLIERIIGHFAQRKDQQDEQPVETPAREPKRLDQERFETLFSSLLHQELTDILRRFADLRQTGTKETRIRTLWHAQMAEYTFLSELMNRDLEDVLHRLGLRLGGSKTDRIERIISHFSASLRLPPPPIMDKAAVEHCRDTAPIAADVIARQDLFRQKASNPQASLQPWLEQLLDGEGQIRCYATEDPNPAKQLKNKLSQAAAARDGMLVLMLSDEPSFFKAREALLERWMTNAEWPKGVACVALAYPIVAPAIEAIIERADGPWASRVRGLLFPATEVCRAKRDDGQPVDFDSVSARCARCDDDLPTGARFCPHCGAEQA